jgi:hypothetical protein
VSPTSCFDGARGITLTTDESPRVDRDMT